MYEEFDQDVNIILERISKMEREDQLPMLGSIIVNLLENASHDLGYSMAEMIETMNSAFEQVMSDFTESKNLKKRGDE